MNGFTEQEQLIDLLIDLMVDLERIEMDARKMRERVALVSVGLQGRDAGR